jgi:protocatechuate 3,4-dioxygenase beta subunit
VSTARRDPDTFPPYHYPAYTSTVDRGPLEDLIAIEATISERTGPRLTGRLPEDADLTRNAGTGAEAIGERLLVAGRIIDGAGAPVPHTVVEIWQANAAGRYIHERDDHPAPLDPNFLGLGRCHTDDDGAYRFTTVRPGAYPWRNHPNAWRPAHIHFSVFGPTIASRLVTQMYFPGDPLQPLDPILSAVPEAARDRLIARYDHDLTEPEWALGYRFDIVLAGPEATPADPDHA